MKALNFNCGVLVVANKQSDAGLHCHSFGLVKYAIIFPRYSCSPYCTRVQLQSELIITETKTKSI